MGLVYALIRLYPFIAFSMVVVLVDIAIALRRKGRKKEMVGVIILGVFFFVSATCWLIFRGDKNADTWFFKTNRVLKN